MPEFAPGIPNKKKFGDLNDLSPGDLLTYVIQRHLARKAGPHYDLRAGTPETDLYSFVTRKSLPAEGKAIGVFRQPLHDFDYKDFEGMIPLDTYGGGLVEKLREGKLLVTKKDGQNIHFTTADDNQPNRYALIHSKKGRDPKHALLVKGKYGDNLKDKKPKIAPVDHNKLQEFISSLPEGSLGQPKVDGALVLAKILKDKELELLSHRKSSLTGKNIPYTEKVYHSRPKADVPDEYKNSLLLGELYGLRNNEAIPPQELGGILNSTIANSIEKQKVQDVILKLMLFDIIEKNKKSTEHLPYADRLKMLDEVSEGIPQAHTAETVQGSKAISKLLDTISKGKHPLTEEGVVVRTPDNKAYKAKLFDEHDVYIRNVFPGEGKYKGTGAGGFEYSMSPTGDILGRVGTGLDDELRAALLKNPRDFINRVARIRAQEQLPSGALRAPSLIAIHENK